MNTAVDQASVQLRELDDPKLRDLAAALYEVTVRATNSAFRDDPEYPEVIDGAINAFLEAALAEFALPRVAGDA